MFGLSREGNAANVIVLFMNFIESVFEKLKRHPKRIVFPEGTEPRILQAAAQFVKRGLGTAILLGKAEDVHKAAAEVKVDLSHIGLIDPAHASDLPVFAERLEKLRHYRDLGKAQTLDILMKPTYFAAMMIQHGQADGLVGGASVYPGTLLRPLIQIVKPLPGSTSVSSCIIVEVPDESFGEKGVMVFADCAVIPEPTVDQLAFIAVQTGLICRQLTGIRPRIALLSFSSKGSAKMPATERIAAATALAKQKADTEKLDLEIDGELQADTALLSDPAERKAVDAGLVAGRANVLIFPDLNSGNIAVKMVKHLAKARTYGQCLIGLSKPCAHVSRAASVDDILGVAAIIGLQAIEYRKIYKTDGAE